MRAWCAASSWCSSPRSGRPDSALRFCGACGKAELWLCVGGFLCFSTLCQNFTGCSPEFHHNSPDFHQMLTRISKEYRVGAP